MRTFSVSYRQFSGTKFASHNSDKHTLYKRNNKKQNVFIKFLHRIRIFSCPINKSKISVYSSCFPSECTQPSTISSEKPYRTSFFTRQHVFRYPAVSIFHVIKFREVGIEFPIMAFCFSCYSYIARSL